MTFARTWERADSPEEKVLAFADSFQQIVVREGRTTSFITDRATLSEYWKGVLGRRNGALCVAHVVFDCKERRLAIVYARKEGFCTPEEADLLQLDEQGLVIRGEVVAGRQLHLLGLDTPYPGDPLV